MNTLTVNCIVFHLIFPTIIPSIQARLAHVILISRNGLRSPLDATFEDNPNEDKFLWPDGYSQLTIRGKKLMYWMGQNVGQMYSSSLYTGDPRNVKVYSMDMDRCVESAQVFTAGVNPPSGRWTWNSQRLLWWQPCRVHEIANMHANCSYVHTSDEWIEFERKHAKQLKQLSKLTGRQVTTANLYSLYDLVTCMKANGKKLPEWVTLSIFDFLEKIYTEMQRIKLTNVRCIMDSSGFLFSIISETLNNVKNIKYNYTILSVPHVNLMALLVGLGKGDELNIPPHGATVLIEIYNKPWRVKVNYVEETMTFKLQPIYISVCHDGGGDDDDDDDDNDNSCPLDQFVTLCNQYKSMS